MTDRANRKEKHNDRQNYLKGERELEEKLTERRNRMADKTSRKEKQNKDGSVNHQEPSTVRKCQLSKSLTAMLNILVFYVIEVKVWRR